jgi:hypothetical protein
MVNCDHHTFGMRQIVCLGAGDIGYRAGIQKRPVRMRGKVTVSSKYGFVRNPGEADILDGDDLEHDTVVDVFVTEFCQSYLEFTEKGEYRRAGGQTPEGREPPIGCRTLYYHKTLSFEHTAQTV